jgi:transcriptional regulator of arginine metabolism
MKDLSTKSLAEALKGLLIEGQTSTQEELCEALEHQGFKVNQSTISRLLRKIKAIKVENEKGESVYSLPREPAPPTITPYLRGLVVDIVSNETTIVIYTSPGSASMIARILDYKQASSEILGTIAGDDTIFVVPKSIQNIRKLLKELKVLLALV